MSNLFISNCPQADKKSQFQITMWLIIMLISFLMTSCLDDDPINETMDLAKIKQTIEVEEAFPGKSGDLTSFEIGDQSLTIRQVEDYHILEGDIVLSENQLNKDNSKAAGLSSLATRWPNGIVYYLINKNLPEKYRVEAAIEHWEEKTDIRFVKRSNQKNYVQFTKGDGCWSYLGMLNKPQMISLADGCTIGNAIHEIGHTLGLLHEHTRADRETYVNINFQNIQYDMEHNFVRYKDQGIHGFDNGRFDFSSIMMYPPTAFAKNKNIPTITRTDGSLYPAQRSGLSAGDINIISGMYGTSDKWTGHGVRGGQGWYVGDFNGDGKDDILRYKNKKGGAEVLLSNGKKFLAAKGWTGHTQRGGNGWYVGDFNGDGKDDILRYKNKKGGAEVLLSNGKKFLAAKGWTGHGVRGGQGWYVGDFNGDGKDDILRYKNKNGGAEVLLSNGKKFMSAKGWTGHGVRGGQGWYVGDFNGDGKDDIMRYKNKNGGAEVLLSNGKKFTSAKGWTGYTQRGGNGWFSGDFDGNGRQDILRFNHKHGGAQILLSNGQKFIKPYLLNDEKVTGRIGWYIGDFNGDGKDDVLKYTNKNGGAKVILL